MAGKLLEITGMRGFAAFYVLVFHALIVFESNRPSMGGAVVEPLYYGWIGVDFFFVLSGFLLALPLLARPDFFKVPGFFTQNAIKRWWRIAPPYYLSILLAFALSFQLQGLTDDPVDLLLHLTFLHSLDPEALISINAVYWTLASEFQFYLVVPFFVLALRGRLWVLGLLGLGAATLLWRGATFQDQLWLSFTLPAFLLHFALGVLAARAFHEKRRIPVPPSVSIPLVIGALIVLPLLLMGARMDQGTHTMETNILLRPLLALGFALVIFLIAREDSFARRLFGSRPMEALGKQSYSLYLTHVPVLMLLNGWKAVVDLGFWSFMLIGVSLCLVASTGFFLMVEGPSMAFREWMLARKSRVPASAAPRPLHAFSAMAFTFAAPLMRMGQRDARNAPNISPNRTSVRLNHSFEDILMAEPPPLPTGLSHRGVAT